MRNVSHARWLLLEPLFGLSMPKLGQKRFTIPVKLRIRLPPMRSRLQQPRSLDDLVHRMILFLSIAIDELLHRVTWLLHRDELSWQISLIRGLAPPWKQRRA